MLDELELAFDESDRGRGRGRRGKGRPPQHDSHYDDDESFHYDGGDDHEPKGRGGRSMLALGISLIILAGLAFGAYVGFSKIQDFFVAADYNSGGEEGQDTT